MGQALVGGLFWGLYNLYPLQPLLFSILVFDLRELELLRLETFVRAEVLRFENAGGGWLGVIGRGSALGKRALGLAFENHTNAGFY